MSYFKLRCWTGTSTNKRIMIIASSLRIRRIHKSSMIKVQSRLFQLQSKVSESVFTYLEESKTSRGEYLVSPKAGANSSFVLNCESRINTLADSPVQLSATRRIEYEIMPFEDQHLDIKGSTLTNVFVKLSEFCDYLGKKQIFEVDWDYIERPDLELTHTYLVDMAYE